MRTGHTPYGYRIENGVAVIDEEQAPKVKKLCEAYLSGMSLPAAADAAGVGVSHASAMRMMMNRHYLGDEFYPQIITPETRKAIEEERQRRAKMYGRENRPKGHKPAKPPATRFVMAEPEEHFEDPFTQAAYLYSLIGEDTDAPQDTDDPQDTDAPQETDNPLDTDISQSEEHFQGGGTGWAR